MDFENEFDKDNITLEIEQEERERERIQYGSYLEYVRKSEDIFIEKLWDTIRYLGLAVAVFFLVRWKFPYLAVDAMLAVSLARPFARYFSRFKIVTEVVKERTGEVEDRFISSSLWFVGAIIGMILSSFFFMGVKPVVGKWFPAYALAPDLLQYGVVVFVMAVPLISNIHDIIACRKIIAFKHLSYEEEVVEAYAANSFEKRKKTNKKLIVIWCIAMVAVFVSQAIFSFFCSFKAEAEFDVWQAWQSMEQPDYALTEEQVKNPVKILMDGYKGECDVEYALPYYDGIYHKNVAMVVSYRYSPLDGWVQFNTESEEEIVSMDTAGIWTGELIREKLIGSTAFDVTLCMDRLTFEDAEGAITVVNKETQEETSGNFTATVTKNEYGILIINVACEAPLEMNWTIHYNLNTHGIEGQNIYRGMLTKQENKQP